MGSWGRDCKGERACTLHSMYSDPPGNIQPLAVGFNKLKFLYDNDLFKSRCNQIKEVHWDDNKLEAQLA